MRVLPAEFLIYCQTQLLWTSETIPQKNVTPSLLRFKCFSHARQLHSKIKSLIFLGEDIFIPTIY